MKEKYLRKFLVDDGLEHERIMSADYFARTHPEEFSFMQLHQCFMVTKDLGNQGLSGHARLNIYKIVDEQ